MITPGTRCRRGACPAVPGTTAHLGCQDLPKSLNDWPDGGRRQLSCLRSGRSLRSRAKLLCLGHACRGPTASPAPIAEIGGALVWPRDSSRLSPETGCRNPNRGPRGRHLAGPMDRRRTGGRGRRAGRTRRRHCERRRVDPRASPPALAPANDRRDAAPRAKMEDRLDRATDVLIPDQDLSYEPGHPWKPSGAQGGARGGSA